MQLKQLSNEVYYPSEDISYLTPEIVDFLKSKASENQRKRCRICTHHSPDDAMHEMFIMHMRGNYIPAHCHMQSDESLTVLQGEGAMLYFNEKGDVTDIFYLGREHKGAAEYVRTPKKKFHSLFVESDFFLFKETILGPFSSDNMYEPEWTPYGYNELEVTPFMERSQQLFLQAKRAALSIK